MTMLDISTHTWYTDSKIKREIRKMDMNGENITQKSSEKEEKNGVTLGEYEVLEDMLMDGLKIVQDTRLYRFTSDSVLLSRFAKGKKGDVVADFCAGSGRVAFHFHALNKDKLHTLY